MARYSDGVSLRSGLRAVADSFAFHGRATRSELVSAAILIALAELCWFALVHFFHPPTAPGLTSLWNRVAFEQGVATVLLVPLLGLAFRRSHDAGFSGWPALVLLLVSVAGKVQDVQVLLGVHGGVPALAWVDDFCRVALLILLMWSPTVGANRFGPDPRQLG